MSFSDFHNHTTFCDGKNTAEEMVLAAIEKNMECIGFSGHSYTLFDTSYCMSQEGTEEYIKEIARLRLKYKDKIKVYCGIELDINSDYNTDRFDYVIGSNHYFYCDGKYLPIDEDKETFVNIVKTYYNGDYNEMAKDYYKTVEKAIDLKVDLIGHYDLITKYNEGNCLFDMYDERYLETAEKTIDKILEAGIPFEVNTGAIGRGYRTTPYPSEPLLTYIVRKGGKLVLSSDSHRTSTLCCEFEKWDKYIKSIK